MFRMPGTQPNPKSTRQALRLVAATGLVALAGCMTFNNTPPTPPVMAAPTIPITVADLVGDWGLASYRKEEDRPRTEVAAKAACSNPYKVTPGPNGGAMMYLADKTEPSEVFVKTGPAGEAFVGPRGAPGLPVDRQVTAYDGTVLVTEWLDKSPRERLGTMIFVRCKARA